MKCKSKSEGEVDIKTNSAFNSKLLSRVVNLGFLISVILINCQILGINGQRNRFPDVPKVTISEYYGNPYYENVRPVSVPRSSELIIGENTSKGIKKLLFECSANYPVQWIYTGDGAPQYSTDSNIRRNSISSGDFFASLTINQLTEGHSGNYTCQGTQDRDSFVSYHLFVPGENIFPSSGKENITQIEFSSRDSTVRIPCSVAHPNARVTLQKIQNGFLNCPLNDSLSFDPKTGFSLRVQDFRDPSGIYVCTATYNDVIKVIQFRLKQRYDLTRDSHCRNSPCGYNAECTYNNGRTACSCRPGFSGDPFSNCVRLSVHIENRERENDACSHEPCGKYGECSVRNNLAVCQCPEGYLGKPPHCMPNLGSGSNPESGSKNTRCISTSDCSPSEVCVGRRCTSQCEKRCGLNAQCRVVNRTPICNCAENYVGDPYQQCYPSEYSSPSSNYEYGQQEERLRPECNLDHECPLELACIHQKCQSPCPRACAFLPNGPCHVRNHKAFCSCPPGDFQCQRFANTGVQTLSGGNGNGNANVNLNGNIGGCQRTNCGPNSQCLDGPGGRATCSCLPNFNGSPPNCAKMCFGNSGCPEHQFCVARKCTDPCEKTKCPIGAKCTVKKDSRQPTCECMEGHIGDPKIRCSPIPGTLLNPLCHLQCGQGKRCQILNNNRPTCKCINPFDTECQESLREEANTRENVREGPDLNSQIEAQSCFNDNECPFNQGCFNGKCLDPCAFFETLCGENQECQPVNRKAACVCKKEFPIRINNDCYRERQFDGRPQPPNRNNPIEYKSSEDFATRRDDTSISYCEPPFCRVGDVRQEHHRCRSSVDCSSTKQCVNSKCVDMCLGTCGAFAVCNMIGRVPRCTCPIGYFGSPKIRCFPLRHLKNGGGQSGGGAGAIDGKDVILLSNLDSDSESAFGGNTNANETSSTFSFSNLNSTSASSSNSSVIRVPSYRKGTDEGEIEEEEKFGGVSASKILQLAGNLNRTNTSKREREQEEDGDED